MKLKTVIILVVFLFVYIGIGGVAFHFLESPNENRTEYKSYQFRDQLLANFTNLTEENFDEVASLIIRGHRRGLLRELNSSLQGSRWTISQSLYFAATVVTTIGYGNVAPTTDLSRAVCIIYAIIGIPVFLLVGASIGSKVQKSVFKLQRKLTGKCLKGKCTKLEKVINTSTHVVVGSVLFILLPAFGFTRLEPWSYWTAIYYSVITLTTIGFGDFVAGHGDQHPLYLIGLSMWILFGLAWLSAVINSMQDNLSHAVEEHAHVLKVPGTLMIGINKRLSKGNLAVTSLTTANGVPSASKTKSNPEEDSTSEEVCNVQESQQLNPKQGDQLEDTQITS